MLHAMLAVPKGHDAAAYDLEALVWGKVPDQSGALEKKANALDIGFDAEALRRTGAHGLGLPVTAIGRYVGRRVAFEGSDASRGPR